MRKPHRICQLVLRQFRIETWNFKVKKFRAENSKDEMHGINTNLTRKANQNLYFNNRELFVRRFTKSDLERTVLPSQTEISSTICGPHMESH